MAHFSGAFLLRTINTEDVVGCLGKQGARPEVVAGPAHLTLQGVCDSRHGGKGQLVFSTVKQYSTELGLSDSLVLIDELPEESEMGTNQFLKVTDPRAAFIDLLQWLIRHVGLDAHKSGFSKIATVSKQANISPHAVVEPGVEIGEGTTVGAGAVIKSGTRIGNNTVIRENVVIGCDGVTVYRAKDGRLLKFPHVAGVLIGSNTEVGANAVIAGGILAPTTIDDDVVIGNLCNVGHGAVIGQGVWLSVGSLLGGHTTVHGGATIAMGVRVRDNLVIGDGASLGMGSVVVKSVGANHSVFGNPAKRMAGLKTGPKR
jgi:UDP-3-O-[3-hydroxymyristoyl] glucosamine N-acyltransferase